MKNENKSNDEGRGSIAKAIILGSLILIMAFSGPLFVVGAGERGVVFNSFSGVKPTSYTEGMHLKLPIFEKAHKFEVRNIKYESEASAASKDLQYVTTKVALNYRLEPEMVPTLYQTVGDTYRSRIIDPSIQEIVKAVTARYNAEELITKRPKVKDDIQIELKDRLKSTNIIVEQMSITNFQFSEEFDKAVEAKVMAEQQALEEQNRLESVKFKAMQSVAEAEGQAKAIKVINEQLRESPDYIEYLKISIWDGHTYTIVPLVESGMDQGILLNLPAGGV